MLTFSRTIACCLALAVLGACTEILNTHSSGDGPPGPGAIPGAPSGDSVAADGIVNFNGGTIQLVADAAVQSGVDLITAGKPHDTTEYAISFRGVKLTIFDQPVLAISALDTDGDLACGLEIAGGEFRLVSGSGTAVIGTYSFNADEHRIFLRLALGQERCFIRIEQVAQGTDGPPVQPVIVADGPFVADQFGDLDRMRVVWEPSNQGSGTSYFLGPTTISLSD